VPAGLVFTIKHTVSSAMVKLPNLVGAQHSYGCAAAVAVAQQVGVTLEQAAAGLQSLVTPPGRLRVLPGIKGTVLIDDTYNSSPIAVEHALETLTEIKYTKRRIAILGDMLELGKYSSDEHRRLGARAASSCDLLITLGVRARGFAEGALANGMNDSTILQYDDVARAGRELQTLLQPGDVVLIKASQGIRAERIVEEVMTEPNKAAELLVRQDVEWKNKK
jgi:UDP-N-acetylmuramoyl-tripeptide--D-alanyl-D-alanine ligase